MTIKESIAFLDNVIAKMEKEDCTKCVEKYKEIKEHLVKIDSCNTNNAFTDYKYKEIHKHMSDSFYSLTREILGEDYYNMSTDIYQCITTSCEDMVSEMKKIKSENKWHKIAITILLIGQFILTVVKY